MKIRTHGPEACRGRHCVIHNPSDHHMVDWPVVHRLDRQVEVGHGLVLTAEGLEYQDGGVYTLTERTCPCGVGHGDPDSLAYAALIGGPEFARVQSVHGCCPERCCARRDPEPDDPEPPLGPWPPVPSAEIGEEET